MANNELIIVLAISTLLIVVAYLIVQRFKVSNAKDKQSHSAMTAGRPDQRADDGAPGVKPRK